MPGSHRSKEIRIATNGASLPVNENERLNASQVKGVLAAFVQGKGRPEKYVWRDISKRFK